PEGTTPVAKPAVKPEGTTPVAKPAVKPEGTTPATKPAVKPEGTTPVTKPAVKPEGTTPVTKPVVKPEGTTPATKPAVKPENNNGSNTTVSNVNYNMTMSKYVGGEIKEYEASVGTNKLTKAQVQNLTDAINPNDIKDMYEFLNVGTYRSVNEQAMENVLASNGVLAGQAQAFINAAKEYNLDPVYLMSQCMFETGHGTSNFAKGITITQYQNANGKMVKLATPVTVYNLFGIGANNSNPTVGATSYAYLHGWTSIPKAIQGAAEFLHNDYIDNQIKQQTPYELRYINGTIGDMWHQYSTNINYAKVLGSLINQYKYLYNSNDQFEFNVPKFEAPQPQQMVALNEVLPTTK
ncbi:MAG: glucosaminidase domain-containing protein, partial [Sarcina sp.]